MRRPTPDDRDPPRSDRTPAVAGHRAAGDGAGEARSAEGCIPESAELAEHVSFVRGVALAMVDDPELADDLSQEAILAALRRPPRLERDLRSWLRGVVRNLARVHFRERSRRTRRERVVAETRAASVRGEDSLDEAVGRAELRQRIARSVLDLDDPYRTILVLRYMEDLTPSEIASLTGRPVATVKTQLARGLERLRTRFDGESGDRTRWQRAFLGLLLPLPVLLMSATTASAASLVTNAPHATTDPGPSGSDAMESGPTGPNAAGSEAVAGGVLLGRAAVALLAVALTAAVVTELVRPGDTPTGEPPAPDEVTYHAQRRAPSDEAPSPEADRGEPTTARPDARSSDLDPHVEPEPANTVSALWTVRVVDPAGNPLPGTTVEPALSDFWLIHGDRSATVGGAIRREESAITDDDGIARLPFDPHVSYRLEHPDFLPTTVSPPATVVGSTTDGSTTVGAATDGATTVTLDPGAVVTLTIVDAHGGTPIPDAEVRIEAAQERRDAIFHLAVISWQEDSPGSEVVRGSETTQTIQPVARTTFEGMAESGPLGSEVLTSEGRALPSRFFTRLEGGTDTLATVRTDAHGTVQVRIDPDRIGAVDVTAEGFAPLHHPALDLVAEDPCTLSLDRGATLRVERRGPDLPELALHLRTGDGARDAGHSHVKEHALIFAAGDTVAQLDGLPAGPSLLFDGPASLAKFLPEGPIPVPGNRSAGFDGVSLGAGGLSEVRLGEGAITLTLPESRSPEHERGEIFLTGRGSLAERSVEHGTGSIGGFGMQTLASGEGRARLDRNSALDRGHTGIPIELRAGETTTVDWSRALSGSLTVEWRTEAGSPASIPEPWILEPWILELCTPAGEVRARATMVGSRFVLERAPVGEAIVRVRAGHGGIVREESLSIEPGATTRVWTMPSGALEILGLSPGAEVFLLAHDLALDSRSIGAGRLLRHRQVEPSGTARFDALPRGTIEWVIVEERAPGDDGPLHVRRGVVTIGAGRTAIAAPPIPATTTRIRISALPTDRPLPEVRYVPRIEGDRSRLDRERLRAARSLATRPLFPGELEATIRATPGAGALLLSWGATAEHRAMTVEVPLLLDGTPHVSLHGPTWFDIRVRARARRDGRRLAHGLLTVRSLLEAQSANDAVASSGAIAHATCTLRLDSDGEGLLRIPAGRYAIGLGGGATHTIEIPPRGAPPDRALPHRSTRSVQFDMTF